MSGRYPIWDYDTASSIARLAHHGQTDKSGAPYIHHPAYVAYKAVQLAALRGFSPEDILLVRQIAWLHDVPEDTRFTHEMLGSLGMPVSVSVPLRLLDRGWEWRKDGDVSYYTRIGANRFAKVVKEADLWHNCRPERLALLDQQTQLRLEAKYFKACDMLGIIDKDAVFG